MKKLRLYFWISFTMLTLFSLSFMAMPFSVKTEENQKAVLMFMGMVFWLSLFAGLIFLFLAKLENKKMNKKNHVEDKTRKEKYSLFENIPVFIADACATGSIIALIILSRTDRISGYVTYINISILAFSISIQILFRGGIYEKIKVNNKKPERKAL